jgi:CBS domain-containing protein
MSKAKQKAVGYDKYMYWKVFLVPLVRLFVVFLQPPTAGMRDVGKKHVRDLMSETPPTIRADANLMEAANKPIEFGVQSLLVVEEEKVIGVLRDQDLFCGLWSVLKR